MPTATAVTAFIAGQPVKVRLTPTANTALGIPDAEVDLYAASILDGWFLAVYQNGNGTTTRYLLPPSSILYAKQDQPDSNATPPQHS